MSRPLLLIPTAMERDRLVAASAVRDRLGGWDIELCGFGVIAAAAMTVRYLNRYRPERVVLAGIAGTLHSDIPVGSAIWFSEVRCDGIGAGGEAGEPFVSASRLGWSQASLSSSDDDNPVEIAECLPLVRPVHERSVDSPIANPGTLLTVCAASSSFAMADSRRKRCAGTPLAEDMEGFAVAMACRLENVPLSIVRGISNSAGDRDHRHWEIDRAIDRVAEQLAPVLPARH